MAFVIINPEYGGLESGKIKNNLIEKNFNLNISRLIYNKLKDQNYLDELINKLSTENKFIIVFFW